MDRTGIITRFVKTTTQKVHGEENRISAVMSTEAEDRDGDIIRVAGWELDEFMDHPVLLSDHNYFSIEAQIGRWHDVTIDRSRKALVGIAEYFVDQGNSKADWGFHLASRDIAAYSVGFIPDMEKAEARAAEEDVPFDPFAFPTFEFNGQKLLETSHVTVPSNPEALQEVAKQVGMPKQMAEIVGKALADKDLFAKVHPEDDDNFDTVMRRIFAGVFDEYKTEIGGRMSTLETRMNALSVSEATETMEELVASWPES